MKENIVTLLYFLGIMGAILMYFVFPNDITHAILFGAICLIITIIPALLLVECGKIVNYYDILDLKTKFDEVVRYKILAVDDIGTEEVLVNFGNKTDIFSEIMDMVEKKSKLVIVTTNYQKKQLEERYGKRVLDRIIATTTRVCFTGKSFRGEL